MCAQEIHISIRIPKTVRQGEIYTYIYMFWTKKKVGVSGFKQK